jgi:hypothetical protein
MMMDRVSSRHLGNLDNLTVGTLDLLQQGQIVPEAIIITNRKTHRSQTVNNEPPQYFLIRCHYSLARSHIHERSRSSLRLD